MKRFRNNRPADLRSGAKFTASLSPESPAAFSLIERYTHEVGRHLPAQNRQDVQAELRSLLLDSLEQRAAESERPVDNDMAAALLREFGHPEEVAGRYRPAPRYLIGPRLYPVFRTVVMAIVLGFAGLFAFAIVLVPVLVTPAKDWPGVGEIAQIFWGYVNAVIWNVAIATLIFAIAEHRMAARPESPREWEPKELPPVKDPDRISVSDRVLRIYWISVVLAVMNFFPQWFGIAVGWDRRLLVLPFEDLGIHVPVLLVNAVCLAAILLHVQLLRRGRWKPAERWWELGLELGWTLVGAVIWMSLTPVAVAGIPEYLSQLFGKVISFAVPAMTVGSGATAVVLLWRLIGRKAYEEWRSSGHAMMVSH
jgi:hypothetical protein